MWQFLCFLRSVAVAAILNRPDSNSWAVVGLHPSITFEEFHLNRPSGSWDVLLTDVVSTCSWAELHQNTNVDILVVLKADVWNIWRRKPIEARLFTQTFTQTCSFFLFVTKVHAERDAEPQGRWLSLNDVTQSSTQFTEVPLKRLEQQKQLFDVWWKYVYYMI